MLKQPRSEPAWLPNNEEFVVNRAEADEASPRRATAVVAKDFIAMLAPRRSSLEWRTRKDPGENFRAAITGTRHIRPSAHQAHIPFACGCRCNYTQGMIPIRVVNEHEHARVTEFKTMHDSCIELCSLMYETLFTKKGCDKFKYKWSDIYIQDPTGIATQHIFSDDFFIPRYLGESCKHS